MATGYRYLVGLLLALVVLGFCVAGGTAEPARAAGGTPYERLTTLSADDDEIDALLSQMDERYNPDGGDASKWEALLLGAGLTATQRKLIAKYITRGGVGARWLPRIGTAASRVSVPLTVGVIAYTIYREYSGGDDQIDMWVDSTALGADSVFNPAAMPALGNFYSADVHWVREVGTCPTSLGAAVCWRLQVGVMADQSGYAFGTWVADGGYTDQWDPYSHRLAGDSPSGNDAYANTVGGVSDFSDRCLVDGDCPDFGSWPNGAENEDAVREIMYVVHATMTAAAADHAGMQLAVNGDDDEGNATVGVYMTEAQMSAATAGTIVDPGGSPYSDDDTTINYTVPATAGTTAKQAQDVAASGQGPCWEAFVNWTVDPVNYPWSSTCFAVGDEGVPVDEPGVTPTTVELPSPTTGETYTDYVARLREAGFLGYIARYSVDEYDGDPFSAAPANSVHRVRAYEWAQVFEEWVSVYPEWVSATWAPWDDYPSGEGWYDDAPSLVAEPVVVRTFDQLRIYARGSSGETPPVVPDAAGGGAPPGVPGGVLNCEDCPELDFTPVTEVEFTEAMPFGIFAWLDDQWQMMTGEGDGECLNASFTRPPGLPAGDDIEIEFCSEAWETTYRPMLWAALYFIFTLAMIIGFARHVLNVPGPVDES